MSAQQQPDSRSSSGGRRISVRQVVGAILLVAFVVFLVENTQRVTVRLIVPEVRTSLALALLIAGVLGALGLLLLQHRRRRG
ncbi:MAG: hypothetical protein ACR2JU_06035 [Nocardioidaceae bacterium]